MQCLSADQQPRIPPPAIPDYIPSCLSSKFIFNGKEVQLLSPLEVQWTVAAAAAQTGCSHCWLVEREEKKS